MYNNTPLRIAIIGATGRLGQAIARLALGNPSFQITAALTHPSSPHLNKDYGAFLGLKPLGLPIATVSKDADLFFDVSLASSAFTTNLSLALRTTKPLVVGTTGLTNKDLRLLEEAASRIPLFYSSNFSLGMALLHKLVEEVARRFHANAQIDLVETHHSNKKDAPSGSALALTKTILNAHPQGLSPRIHSIRSGQIVGEHELFFNTAEERLSLSHQVHTRDAFARGALAAALFLASQPPGLYGMEHLLKP